MNIEQIDPMQLFRLDDSRMPLRLGSALRVPSYAYKRWGIPEYEYRRESDACYENEWAAGSPAQLDCVRQGLEAAEMLDYTSMLQNAAAEAVAEEVANIRGTGTVYILDIGGGSNVNGTGSTPVIFDALDDRDKERVHFTIVNPARQFAEGGARQFDHRDFDRYTVHVAKDTDLSKLAEPGAYDITVQVATQHHHAYIIYPFQMAGRATKNGGLFVSADWHNPAWEHPARVLQILEEGFEWDTKGSDIDAFRRMFPLSAENAPIQTEKQRAAYGQIRQFWQGWAAARTKAIEEGRFLPNDDIYMLEGHRPVSRYKGVLWVHGGFNRIEEENLVEGSEILTVLKARRKPA